MNIKQLYADLEHADNCLYISGDSRDLVSQLPPDTVDCIITSPPYYDLKDYGPKNQLGYNQSIESGYYPDLLEVFRHLHKASKTGAALWLVLDMAKKEKTILSLPWAMSELCTKAGWQFQDLVVWDKGKSLPWTHKGRFRNVCEYILLLSKGDLRHFNVDAVRNAENLSSYWKKYPERYNPLGSAPTDLWHFPIPVQGAWGTGGVRHACPFPLELVNRMVQLTTRQNDLILDPFAGSGSVLAMARACGRLAIGFDLSEDYKNAFLLSGRNQLLSDAANLLRASHGRSMGQTIIELRTLKTAVTLLKHVSRHDRFGDSAISCCRGVTVWRQPASSESSLAKALVTFYYDVAVESDIACHLSKAVLDSPVAKFCLEVEAKVMPISSFDSAIRGACKALWLYNNGRFYESGRQIDCDEAIQMTGHRHRAGSWPPLISNVNPMAESVAE